MTFPEFMQALLKKFPRSAALIQAWEDEYRTALARYAGPALKSAYDAVMLGWNAETKAAFPRPGDFAVKCRPVAHPGDSTNKARMEYIAENTKATTLKCIDDAKRRCDAAHGPEVTVKVAGYIRWQSQRIANYYVQRRFLAEAKTPDYMNGSRWKFTDAEIAELPSRALTHDILAGVNTSFPRFRRMA